MDKLLKERKQIDVALNAIESLENDFSMEDTYHAYLSLKYARKQIDMLLAQTGRKLS